MNFLNITDCIENFVVDVTMVAGEMMDDEVLSAGHVAILNQCAKKVKDTVTKLSSEHKDLHSSVSKVGKAIDKVRNSMRMGGVSVIYVMVIYTTNVPIRGIGRGWV